MSPNNLKYKNVDLPFSWNCEQQVPLGQVPPRGRTVHHRGSPVPGCCLVNPEEDRSCCPLSHLLCLHFRSIYCTPGTICELLHSLSIPTCHKLRNWGIVSMRWSQDSNPGHLASKFSLLTPELCHISAGRGEYQKSYPTTAWSCARASGRSSAFCLIREGFTKEVCRVVEF